jgi:heme exporter protein D
MKKFVLLIVLLLFVALLFIAINQTVIISLIILLTLFVLQVIIARHSNYGIYFAWNAKKSCLTNKRRKKVINYYVVYNLLFNTINILTILTMLTITLSSSEVFLSRINSTGVTIWTCISIILLVFYNLKSEKDIFYKFKGSLVISTLTSIVYFSYLTFGTNFIWLSPAVLFLLYVIDGYSNLEIDDYLKYYDSDHIYFGSLIISIVLSLISLAVIYWENLVNFYYYFISIQVINGTYLWVWLVSALSIFLIVVIANKEVRKKRKQRKLLEEKENRERRKQDKILQNEINEEIRKENIGKLLQKAENNKLSLSEVIYLSKNDREADISAWGVRRVNLEKLITVSHVKNQIIWARDLENILSYYNLLYNSKFSDDELVVIKNEVNSFIQSLQKYRDFYGYDILIKNINERVDFINVSLI